MTARPRNVPEAAWQRFIAAHSSRPPRPADLQAASELLGRPLPLDLAVQGFSQPPDGSCFEPGLLALAAADGNVFEHLLAGAGDSHEPLAHWLTGCHFYFEMDGDGDCMFVALPALAAGPDAPTAVVRWSQDEAMMADGLAPDLACFDWVWEVWNQRRGKTRTQVMKELEPIEGRWELHFPLRSLEDLPDDDEAATVTPVAAEPGSDGWKRLQTRGRWIADLLAGEDAHPDPADRAADRTAALASPDFARDVPEALYWLLSSLLLAEDEATRDLCARLADSPSRMLRDAAAVVAEVVAGRRTALGTVEDVQALRRAQAERFADPEGYDRRREEARQRAEEARILAAVPAPLTLRKLAEAPAGVRWQGADEGAWYWPLADGTTLRVRGSEIAIVPAGLDPAADDPDEDDTTAPRPTVLESVATSLGQIESAWLRADQQILLTGTKSALFEVSLPSGATSGAWWAGLDSDASAAYLTPDRVLRSDSDGRMVLHQRSEALLLVPGPSCGEDTGEVFGLVADGKVALASGGNQLALVGIYGDRLAELARLPLGVERVGLCDGRAILRSDDACWELGGLDAAHADATPAPWQPPEVPRAQRIDGDPRAATPAAEPWPKAPHTFMAGGTRFAMLAGEEGYDLVWDAGGKTRRSEAIPFEPTLASERVQLHVTVSPKGKRALIWRNFDSWVRVVDLTSGKELARHEDDAQSGMVKDACWLDDKHFAFAHWQSYLYRVGEEDAVLEIEQAFTSIAAAPGAKGRWLVAGIQAADADGPQRLVAVVIDRLSGELEAFHRTAVPLPERAATVRRDGDSIVLEVGDAWWRLAPVTADEEMPEEDEDDDQEADEESEDA